MIVKHTHTHPLNPLYIVPDNFLIKFPNEPEKHFRNTSNNTSEKRNFVRKNQKAVPFLSHNHVFIQRKTEKYEMLQKEENDVWN